jgi:hypothetical protein
MSIAGSTRNQNNGESFMISCPASSCPLPTWNRTFSSADALLDHARQTRALHPLCPTCNRVFKDTAALDQVRDFFFSSRTRILYPSLTIHPCTYFVARRSKTRCYMSTLQPEIQVPIRSRPTLASFDRASQLSRLRGRRPGCKRPRRGEPLAYQAQ